MMNQIVYLMDKSLAEKIEIVRVGADHLLDFTFTQKCKGVTRSLSKQWFQKKKHGWPIAERSVLFSVSRACCSLMQSHRRQRMSWRILFQIYSCSCKYASLHLSAAWSRTMFLYTEAYRNLPEEHNDGRPAQCARCTICTKRFDWWISEFNSEVTDKFAWHGLHLQGDHRRASGLGP